MATITQITKMNLPELINYVWENGIKNEIYRTIGGRCVMVNSHGAITMDSEYEVKSILPGDIFILNVEKEITEDTKIPNLVGMHYDFNGDINVEHFTDISINELKYSTNHAFYMVDDDLTLTLLWKDGCMV